ncbi:MAG: hypothetical protein GC168_21580 [Candidatus Hydrogenedens sp.]|nr:hypothetical protein [Candidatus Hydrogenedens sp.]
MPVKSTSMILLAAFVVAWPAAAHRLVEVTDRPFGPENALEIEEIAVSQVGYHVASESAPTLWMTFEAVAGDLLYFETGVPFIERYGDLRPSVALIGPGLPEASLPFAIPAGLGALVFSTQDVAAPEVFSEPFTGTESWKFGPWERTLETSGRYYLVTYLPDLGPGKFWTAVGRAEEFGIADILTLPQTIVSVRSYHEIFPLGGVLFWGMVAAIAVIVSAAGAFLSKVLL